jgi:hypothetical protein
MSGGFCASAGSGSRDTGFVFGSPVLWIGLPSSPASGPSRRPEGQLHPAEAGSDEGQQPHSDLLPGSGLGHPPDETLVKGAHDGSVGVMGIDAEGAVADIDGHDVLLTGRWSGSEGEALEGLDDLLHRLLGGGMTEGPSEFPAPPGSLLLGGGHGPFTVGPAEERYQAADEEADLGVTAEKGMPEAVALGGPAPSPGDTGLLLEHPGLEKALEVGAHRRRVDPKEAGELGNLARPLFEGLHDGQAPDVPQEAVTLGPDTRRKMSVHVQSPHRPQRRRTAADSRGIPGAAAGPAGEGARDGREGAAPRLQWGTRGDLSGDTHLTAPVAMG